MDIRYSTGKEPFKRMTTEELRQEFLIQNIFNKDDVSCVYSHVDRIVTMGAMPVDEEVNLEKNIDPWKNFGVNYLLERRELGTINIGGDEELRRALPAHGNEGGHLPLSGRFQARQVLHPDLPGPQELPCGPHPL